MCGAVNARTDANEEGDNTARQRQLNGRSLHWAGTYRHGAGSFLRFMEQQYLNYGYSPAATRAA